MQRKFTLSYIRTNMYIWKTKFTSHLEYLFGLLFSRKASRLIQTKVYCKLFYLVRKETFHKPLKEAAAKKSFPSVHIIDKTCFDEYFLFHVIAGRHYFLYKLSVTQKFGAIAILLRSLKQGFWKWSAVYIHYLHKNKSVLLML